MDSVWESNSKAIPTEEPTTSVSRGKCLLSWNWEFTQSRRFYCRSSFEIRRGHLLIFLVVCQWRSHY
jgi:hypothetical protein